MELLSTQSWYLEAGLAAVLTHATDHIIRCVLQTRPRRGIYQQRRVLLTCWQFMSIVYYAFRAGAFDQFIEQKDEDEEGR
eukprot:768810-Hanusia_phi.AAC.22